MQVYSLSLYFFFSGMSIPLRNITEVLGIVLSEGLKYHPNHIILLKLKGDLQYGTLKFDTKKQNIKKKKC